MKRVLTLVGALLALSACNTTTTGMGSTPVSQAELVNDVQKETIACFAREEWGYKYNGRRLLLDVNHNPLMRWSKSDARPARDGSPARDGQGFVLYGKDLKKSTSLTLANGVGRDKSGQLVGADDMSTLLAQAQGEGAGDVLAAIATPFAERKARMKDGRVVLKQMELEAVKGGTVKSPQGFMRDVISMGMIPASDLIQPDYFIVANFDSFDGKESAKLEGSVSGIGGGLSSNYSAISVTVKVYNRRGETIVRESAVRDLTVTEAKLLIGRIFGTTLVELSAGYTERDLLNAAARDLERQAVLKALSQMPNAPAVCEVKYDNGVTSKDKATS